MAKRELIPKRRSVTSCGDSSIDDTLDQLETVIREREREFVEASTLLELQTSVRGLEARVKQLEIDNRRLREEREEIRPALACVDNFEW